MDTVDPVNRKGSEIGAGMAAEVKDLNRREDCQLGTLLPAGKPSLSPQERFSEGNLVRPWQLLSL